MVRALYLEFYPDSIFYMLRCGTYTLCYNIQRTSVKQHYNNSMGNDNATTNLRTYPDTLELDRWRVMVGSLGFFDLVVRFFVEHHKQVQKQRDIDYHVSAE